MTEIGKEFWDISPLYLMKAPRTKRKIVCPVCGSDVIYFKQAHAFKRSINQYRVDIIVKCGYCAYVMTFGVHITEDEFGRIPKIVEYRHTGHVNVNEVI